jgi:hypothetical protein
MMQQIVCFACYFCFLVSGGVGYAQVSSYQKALEEVKKLNYGNARALCQRMLDKEPVLASYGFAQVYTSLNRLDSAVYWLLRAEQAYKASTTEKKDEYAQIQLTVQTIKKFKDQLALEEYRKLTEKPTREACLLFLKRFPQAVQAADVRKRAETLFFEEVRQKNTAAAYFEFLNLYPESSHVPQVKKWHEERLFIEATDAKDDLGYATYIKTHPQGAYVQAAHDTLFNRARAKFGFTELHHYTVLFPDGPYIEQCYSLLFDRYELTYGLQGPEKFLAAYPRAPEALKAQARKWNIYATRMVLPYKYQNRWGIMDTTGDTILPPTFEYLDVFRDGLAPFQDKQDLIGFVDLLGRVRIQPSFDTYEPFQGGVSWVEYKGKFGILDRTGKWHLKPVFDEIGVLENNRRPVKVGKLWGVTDGMGRYIFPPQFEELRTYVNGLACYRKDSLYGYITPDGFVQITPRFRQAQDFAGNYAVVSEKPDTFGLIDRYGIRLIPDKYTALGSFQAGWSWAVLNNKTGWIDTRDSVVIPFQFDARKEFHSLYTPIGGAYQPVVQAGKVGLWDTARKTLALPCQYERIQYLGQGRWSVRSRGQWLLLDSATFQPLPGTYDLIKPYHHGWAPAMIRGRWTVLNLRGQPLFPPLFLALEPRDSLLYVVKTENGVGLGQISAGTWKQVVPCRYRELVFAAWPWVAGLTAQQSVWYNLLVGKPLQPRTASKP